MLGWQRRANLVHPMLLGWSLLANGRQIDCVLTLCPWNCLSNHRYLHNLLNSLHVRHLNNLLHSGDVRHIHLLHNGDVHNFLDGLDHGHVHVLLRNCDHGHMAMFVNRDMNVVVNVLDLRYLDCTLHRLHHGNVSM
jgi:hypothetical protein